MTQNQFYADQLKETALHNRRTEEENKRHNLAQEQYNLDSLNESRRHSQVSEYLTGQANRESVRSHKASEYNTGRSISNALRHDLETESNARRSTENTYDAARTSAIGNLYKGQAAKQTAKMNAEWKPADYGLQWQNTQNDTSRTKYQNFKNIASGIRDIASAAGTILPTPSNVAGILGKVLK